jgi:hypothetical protein
MSPITDVTARLSTCGGSSGRRLKHDPEKYASVFLATYAKRVCAGIMLNEGAKAL